MTCPECRGGVTAICDKLTPEIPYRRCEECTTLERADMQLCSTCHGFVCFHIELVRVEA